MSDELLLGVALGVGLTAAQCIEEARHAARVGFDLVELPDHLGIVAPLPTLAAISAAIPGLGVTNHVLNAAFYRPHLLARDIAAVHQVSQGKFITSLGTGYSKAEFDVAGIPFPSAGRRIEAVRELTLAIREILVDPAYVVQAGLPVPPTRIAGNGDRTLTMAAEVADIVMIDPVVTEAGLAERIDFVRAKAGERAGDIRFSFAFSEIDVDGSSELPIVSRARPDLSRDELRDLPTVLTGGADEAVEKIRRVRGLGVDYLDFIRTSKVGWASLERLVTAVREG